MESSTAYPPFLLLGVFTVSALLMGLVPVVLARIWTRWVGTARPDEVKNAVYECGLETGDTQWMPLKAEYYLYGIIFLVFDVEILFLLPIASVYQDLPWGAVGGLILFVFLLMEGLAWAWAKGLLKWQFAPIQKGR
jgi:NADH:ubiquinone oxidoreductase subunit 3 (subunit A)